MAIVGCGLVTPLGGTACATWDALLAGRFITTHSRAALAEQAGEHRLTRLSLAAAREAISAARWTADGAETALVVGTSKGPIEEWITPPPHMSNLACERRGGFEGWGLAQTASQIAADLWNVNGLLRCSPCLTLSAACASGLHALIRGVLMLRSGEVDRVLVVAVESSLHPLFLGSFKRLGVLPPEEIGCRPLDQRRAGFLLSEAAAAVCLERRPDHPESPAHAPSHHRSRAGARPVVERFTMAGDATHLTGGDPDARTLRRILRDVVDGRPVDLIHAHATGTVANDPTELAAIESAVAGIDAPRRPPFIYSHKGALGHSLGAAGLVSVVLSCRMHQRGIVLPNVRATDPLPAAGVEIAQAPVERPIHRSIAIAAGFGGATAAVSLRTT